MPRIEGHLAEALTLLSHYFEHKGISFALVGALVPAILLSSEVGVRETRDADHVIKLSSWEEWEVVIADLLKLGFVRGRGEQEHRLHYKTAEIDLIPYGIMNGPEEVLIWRKSGNEMNLTGFADVFLHAERVQVTKGLTLPVIPLWLFAVLKVVAYTDRKYPRDLRDLVYLMERYELDQARRFELAGAVPGITYETSGAYLLGVDIRTHAEQKAAEIVREFFRTIKKEEDPLISTSLGETGLLHSDERRTFIYQLIVSFQKGLG